MFVHVAVPASVHGAVLVIMSMLTIMHAVSLVHGAVLARVHGDMLAIVHVAQLANVHRAVLVHAAMLMIVHAIALVQGLCLHVCTELC